MKIQKSLIVPSLVILTAVSATAATITSTWNGGTSGTANWEVDGNWTPSSPGKPYPNNGADKYNVVIGSTTGDRTIQTSGTLSIDQLGITQSVSSVGISTLKLGGNMTVLGNSATDSHFTNATNDASKLVLDLNGHTFTITSSLGSIKSAAYYTLTGGGTYQTASFYHNTGPAQVNAGVTVKVTASGIGYVSNVIWADTAAFHYAANSATSSSYYGAYGSSAPADTLANVTVGDHANTVASTLALGNATTSNGVFVKGNVNILSYGGSGSSAKLSISTGKLNIGGNFVDEGTDSYSYGTGTLLFNGGSATERTLSTGRADITTSFQVGRTATEAGNVALGQDLTTSGSFTVLRESLLNVKNFTLSAANVNLDGGTSTSLIKPTLGFTFGGINSGLIDASGTLTLGFATLNVTYDGSGWVNGSDLELFQFGTLSGGTLSNLTVNTFGGIFSTGGLAQIGNSIYLTNVVVPEPGSATLLMVAGALLLFRRRRTVA